MLALPSKGAHVAQGFFSPSPVSLKGARKMKEAQDGKTWKDCGGAVVALASAVWMCRPMRVRGRLPKSFRRSRGGESEDDFFAGFRVALGSREQQLEEDLLVAQDALAQMQEKFSQAKQEKDMLQKELAKSQTEVTSARQQRLSAKEALAKLERELLSSKEETKIAQVEQERLKQCVEKQQQALEEDLEILEASKVEGEQRWERITEDMSSRLAEVEEEKRELEVKLSEVEMKLDVDQEKVIKELQEKWHRSQAEKNKLEGQMSQFRLEADEKVKNLNAALQSEKAARTTLEEQLQEDLKKVQADLKNKSMTAAEEVKLLQAEKKKLEGQMSQFRQEADEEAKNLNAALQSEKAASTALEKQLKEELKKVQADFKKKSMTAAEEVKFLKAKGKELEKDLNSLRKEAEGQAKGMKLTLELEKEKVLQAQRDTEVVAAARSQVEEELENSEEKVCKLEKELSRASMQIDVLEKDLAVAEDQISLEKNQHEQRLKEIQQAASMLKEHTHKFKEQEARKAAELVEEEKALRMEAMEKMCKLKEEFDGCREGMKQLESTALTLSSRLKCTEEQLKKQREREQLEKEVLRESVSEIHMHLKGKKEQLAAERARNEELQVAHAAQHRLREEQTEYIEHLKEELLEVPELRERVRTLESCQQTMGDCLKEYQRRAREAEEKVKNLLQRLEQSLCRSERQV